MFEGGTAIFSPVQVAAVVPHAPQILSVPQSEDPEQIARVKGALKQVGQLIVDAGVDLIALISNDHADNFGTHCVPPFYVHCGTNFAENNDLIDFDWPLMGDSAQQVVADLYESGFDPAHGHDVRLGSYFSIPLQFLDLPKPIPVLPILINCYIPPQPTMTRCAAFGSALRDALARGEKKVAVIASGGLSHYPGTARYADPGPDLEFDRALFESVKRFGPGIVTGLGGSEIEIAGNIELRSWAMLAGMVDRTALAFTMFEENWHHTYALACWQGLGHAFDALDGRPYYAGIPASAVATNRALFALRNSPAQRAICASDPRQFAADHDLSEDVIQAIVERNSDRLRDEFGGHPLLASGAIRALQGATY